jgi:hypothetical protein
MQRASVEAGACLTTGRTSPARLTLVVAAVRLARFVLGGFMRKPLLTGLMLLALAAPLAAQQKEAAKQAPPPAPKIKVGSTAPDFTLKDQAGNDVSLSSFRGKKNVVLAFYIFAFTGG